MCDVVEVEPVAVEPVAVEPVALAAAEVCTEVGDVDEVCAEVGDVDVAAVQAEVPEVRARGLGPAPDSALPRRRGWRWRNYSI